MRVVMLAHSLVSDWNHGNAHFLRGVASELLARGHQVEVHEAANAWSVENLLAEHGPAALARFHAAYPELRSHRYAPGRFDLEQVLEGAELVLMHEWNDRELVRRVGRWRLEHRGCCLLFHDTHTCAHRVDQLLGIVAGLRGKTETSEPARREA